MSDFDALFESNVQPKSEEVVIDANGKKITFTAKEISYLERLHLSALSTSGSSPYAQLITYSIVDADGNRMTLQQANSLPHEYAEKLFIAATKVNSQQVKTEKN